MTRVRASHPRFQRGEDAPRIELTDDDIEVLRLIYRLRFVRADDLYRYFPHRSPDRLSRRLMLLYRGKYLDRPIAQIDRYRAGGSKALVYGIDNAGARYLKETLRVPITGSDWRGRNRSHTRENLDHTLAVSRFLIDVEILCRSRAKLSFIPFEEILTRAPEATRHSSHPGRWPVEVLYHGVRGIVHIIPDAIFGLRMRTSDGRSVVSYYFLEVDRGTMTIAPTLAIQGREAFLYRATILRKFVTYAESWRQKLHETHLGIRGPKVLTLTTGVSRAHSMRRLARKVAQEISVPQEMFGFGLEEVGTSQAMQMNATSC